jgi:CubicO group peptidase (beta-lactamase class C family)
VPGVVALVAQGRDPIYAGAFGVRSLERPQPMTLDSVFYIASMTKPVTTTAALQLVEQGKLALDQPAGEILAELKAPQVLDGFDAQGKPILRPARTQVTLRNLLTHTSGFTYDVWDRDMERYRREAGVPPTATGKNAALVTPLSFDPGARWEYGTGIDWAGKMVEKASGQRLDAYVREHIFEPLGMNDTSYRPGPAQRDRVVAMHARQADGSLKVIEFSTPEQPEFIPGGGGLYSTAPDYLRFARMILGHGSLDGARVLKPETVADMGRNQIGDVDVVLLKTTTPQRSLDAEFFPGLKKKWGLGFMINAEDAPTGRSAGSLAWAGIANTYFWIDPKRELAGVVMMQLLPFVDTEAMATFTAFESGIYKVAADLTATGSSTPPKR